MAKVEFALLCGMIALCSALDFELSKEGPCLNPRPQPAAMGHELYQDKTVTWYTPLVSKYELYRVAEDLTRKSFEDITDEELKNSCIRYKQDYCITGFGQKQCYDLISADKDTLSYVWKVQHHAEWDAETWVTKADKDYAVSVTCWSTGQRSFSVASSTKTLHPTLKAEILDHVKSMGFNSKYIYEANYDEGCEDEDEYSELNILE